MPISDPALLHAWLASIAKALCTLCGSNLHSDIDYHVSRAISIVNNRIANANHTPITKETIMAVTYLTNVGVRYVFSLMMAANIILSDNSLTPQISKSTLTVSKLW
jgi:hypothetical protein